MTSVCVCLYSHRVRAHPASSAAIELPFPTKRAEVRFPTAGGNKVCKRGILGLALVLVSSDCTPRGGYACANPPSVTPSVGYVHVITKSHSIIKLHVVGVSLIKVIISCELLDSSGHYLNTRCVGLPSCPAGIFELLERARIRHLCPTTETCPTASIISPFIRPQHPRDSGFKVWATTDGVLNNHLHIILFSRTPLIRRTAEDVASALELPLPE